MPYLYTAVAGVLESEKLVNGNHCYLSALQIQT